jgi:hypothetical protein
MKVSHSRVPHLNAEWEFAVIYRFSIINFFVFGCSYGGMLGALSRFLGLGRDAIPGYLS